MKIMFHLTIVVTLLHSLTGCSNSDNKAVAIDKRIFPREPDKDHDRGNHHGETGATEIIIHIAS